MDISNIDFFIASVPTTFKWPVRVPVPADGNYSHVAFTGVWKYLNDEQEAELLSPARQRTDREILSEVLIGVEGLKTRTGDTVHSSPELIAAVIAVDRVAPVAVATYLAARRGMAAEKN